MFDWVVKIQYDTQNHMFLHKNKFRLFLINIYIYSFDIYEVMLLYKLSITHIFSLHKDISIPPTGWVLRFIIKNLEHHILFY